MSAVGRRRVVHGARFLLAFRAASDGPLSWRRSVAIATIGLALGLLCTPSTLTLPNTFGVWGIHGAISLEVAINRVAFDRASHVDERVSRWLEAGNDPTLGFADTWPMLRGSLLDELRDESGVPAVPLRALAASTAATKDEYVARLVPYAHNESALTSLVELALHVHPDLTFRQALASMHAIRLLSLWLFALALLRGGASPVMTWAALTIALQVLAETIALPPLAGLYASLLPGLLGAISGVALLIGIGPARRSGVCVAWCVVAGACAVLLSNLRTSYTPIAGALLTAYLVGAALDLRACRERSRRRRVGLWAANALALALGAAAMDRVAFAPARVIPLELNAHHHGVAHPLVLSLALPPDELARSEGIEWSDFRGILLARREDPSVRYLGPGYEEALFAYYRRLWRERPREMWLTYATKFGTAGASALEHCRTAYRGRAPGKFFIRTGTLPVVWVRHGLLFLGLAAAVVLLGAMCLRRRRLPREGCWILGGLGGTAALCYVESAMIVSTHNVGYHGFLVFFLAFVGSATNVYALDLLRRACERPRPRPRARC